jgi:light-regulated signal transduction histidine kinase (bacteriophytochrome)
MFATLVADRLAGRIDHNCTEWLSLIQSEVRHMHSIIESLLDYSRFNADRLRVLECDCDGILAGVSDGLKADLLASGAELTHDALPTVTADPMQLSVFISKPHRERHQISERDTSENPYFSGGRARLLELFSKGQRHRDCASGYR